jgi:hypothetical protein
MYGWSSEIFRYNDFASLMILGRFKTGDFFAVDLHEKDSKNTSYCVDAC